MDNEYIQSIKEVYPDFGIEKYAVNEIGQNNKVFIVNDEFVFRFPKYKAGIVKLKKEIELLSYLNFYHLKNKWKYLILKVSSKWTRPISYTPKKDKERLKRENPANAVVPLRNVDKQRTSVCFSRNRP